MRPLFGALSTALALAAAGAQPGATLPPTARRTPVVLRGDIPEGGGADPSLADVFGARVGGVAADGVARLSVFVTPTSALSCTGALVGPHTILTAAHCVTDDLTGALVTASDRVRARFVGPGDAPVDLWSRRIAVPSAWRGFFDPSTDGGADVALVDLDGAVPTWLTPYALFDGDPLFRDADFVGEGAFGSGASGTAGFDGRRRWGQNRVDYVSDPFFGPGDGVLWTDFDDGLRQNDAFCWATGGGEGNPFCDGGRGATEVGLGPGDSGGPLFIDGRIAGVASFVTAFCGDPQCDTVASPPLVRPDVPDGWGSLSGFASASYNAPWILDEFRRLDAPPVVAAPEPTPIALLGLGLLALLRRPRPRA